MNRLWEELIEEERAKAAKEAKAAAEAAAEAAAKAAAKKAERNKAVETAVEMISDGELPLQKIAQYSGLSLEEVKALANGKTA